MLINDLTIEELKKYIFECRNDIGNCPVCNSNIKDRTISLYQGLIDALYRVYCYCGQKQKHEFMKKEVKHLFGKNEYARFGDLVRFGGIVYKPKDEAGNKHKAEFGINMQRAKAFFRREYKIPIQIIVNQITNEIVAATYASIDDFPTLFQLLNDHGLYDHERLIHVKIDLEKQKQAGIEPVQNYQESLI